MGAFFFAPAFGYALPATAQLRTDRMVGGRLSQLPALGYGVMGATARLFPLILLIRPCSIFRTCTRRSLNPA
jgi:hypothetical protein